MRIINRYIMTLLAGGVILGLTACGGSTPATTQPSASAPGASETIAAIQPSASSSAAPGATSATTPAAAATQVAQADRPYAALPQSRTSEGYYVLGQADAPVALTFYSDFL